MKTTSNKQAEDNAPINDFNGHYQFLNNDFPAWVCLQGQLYPSVSIAYQASRTTDLSLRKQLQQIQTYPQFKELALSIHNPPDWASKKYKVMSQLVRDKFKRTKELGGKLASTNPRNLVNTFKCGGQNEQYWGVVDGKGNNSLGKILVNIRQQILNGSDWDSWISDQGVQTNDKRRPQAALVVIKQDKPIDKLFLDKKSKYFMGAAGACPQNDVILEHPSISKKHACLYFNLQKQLVLVDLGSSNGTTITRQGKTTKLQELMPVVLEKGDLIIFGLSTRKYRVELGNNKSKGTSNQKSRGKDKSRSRSRSPPRSRP